MSARVDTRTHRDAPELELEEAAVARALFDATFILEERARKSSNWGKITNFFFTELKCEILD